jgi:hypothetical protein
MKAIDQADGNGSSRKPRNTNNMLMRFLDGAAGYSIQEV